MKKWVKEMGRNLSKEQIQITNGPMKKCSGSLEIQIKTTWRFHLTQVRLAYIQKSANTIWYGCGEKGTLLHHLWECRVMQLLWKSVWRVLRQLNIDLPYEPAISLLGIHPKEEKSAYEKASCNPVPIAAQSTTMMT